MKTVFNNSMVIHVWAQMSQPYGQNSSGSLSFNGGELVSYNTAIALHYGAFVLRSDDHFSPTTAKHRPSSYDCNVKVIDVVNIFAWDKRFNYKNSFPTGGEIKKDLLDQIFSLSVEYPKKRTDSTRGRVVERMRWALDNLLFICNHFKLKYPAGYGNVEQVLNTTGKAVKRAQEAEARAARKRKKAAEKRRQEARADFERWLNGESRAFPYSYKQTNEHFLTVIGDKVITSGGAQAPIDHAKRALKLYRRVVAAGQGWARNGERCRLGVFELDSIDKAGNAVAGCHHFRAKEIKRFSEKWGF